MPPDRAQLAESDLHGREGTDSKYRLIIAALQTNGRFSNQEPSERGNLSPSPCLRRLRQRNADGVIWRNIVLVDGAASGLPATAFVRVRLQRHGSKIIAEFKAAITRLNAVIDCYMMTGDAGFLLRVRVQGLSDYERLIRSQFHIVRSIASIDTNFAYCHVKRATVFPAVPGSRTSEEGRLRLLGSRTAPSAFARSRLESRHAAIGQTTP